VTVPSISCIRFTLFPYFPNSFLSPLFLIFPFLIFPFLIFPFLIFPFFIFFVVNITPVSYYQHFYISQVPYRGLFIPSRRTAQSEQFHFPERESEGTTELRGEREGRKERIGENKTE
jgi:hypothetical protein